MLFWINHGSFGNSKENWIPWLRRELESLGHEVITPDFPCDDYEELTNAGLDFPAKHQDIDNWIKYFEEKIYNVIKDKEIVFVGHSLSPVFFLHVTDRFELNINAAVFIAPFLETLGDSDDLWQFEVVNRSFHKTNFNWDKLRESISDSYVLYSKSDPYVPEKLSVAFADGLGSSIIKLKGGGHLGSSMNGEFPLVLELCKSRVDVSEYIK